MKKLLAVILGLLLLAGQVGAATTTTTNLHLPIPPLGVTGTADGYGTLMQSAEDYMFAAFAPKYPTAAAGGTVDAITATYSPAVALTNGTRVILVAAGANTGAVTFVPNGLTSKAIVKVSATPLVAGDIPAANYPCDLEYNGTAWVLLNPSVNPTSATLGSGSTPSLASYDAYTDSETADLTSPAIVAVVGTRRIIFFTAIRAVRFDTSTTLKGNGSVSWTTAAGAWMELHSDGTYWRCAIHGAD